MKRTEPENPSPVFMWTFPENHPVSLTMPEKRRAFSRRFYLFYIVLFPADKVNPVKSSANRSFPGAPLTGGTRGDGDKRPRSVLLSRLSRMSRLSRIQRSSHRNTRRRFHLCLLIMYHRLREKSTKSYAEEWQNELRFVAEAVRAKLDGAPRSSPPTNNRASLNAVNRNRFNNESVWRITPTDRRGRRPRRPAE